MRDDRSSTLGTIIDQRKADRDAIAADVEAFKKKGGVISVYEPGYSGDRAEYGRSREDRK